MTKAPENPPLTSYYIALLGTIAGWSESALHLGFLLPALAAVWGIYSLARNHCHHPWVAALIAIVTPVFLISATTVMSDVMLLAFWTWSLVFFERGLQIRGSFAFPRFQRFSVSAFQLFFSSGLLAGL